MTEDKGAFVWYELMTPDAAGARDFYGAVVGWSIADKGDALPNGGNYRMIMRSDGRPQGGVFELSLEMRDGGMDPGWFGYIHTPDVDSTARAFAEAGGKILAPANTMEGVGRMAMVADPQGAAVYLMDPVPPADDPEARADVFADGIAQRCAWNELATGDPNGAIELYTAQFGWELPEPMDMGEMGKYHFVAHEGTKIGAIFRKPAERPRSVWTHYFTVPSIDTAIAAIGNAGGQVMMGPMEVPGGDLIVLGIDPQGAEFALVGPN